MENCGVCNKGILTVTIVETSRKRFTLAPISDFVSIGLVDCSNPSCGVHKTYVRRAKAINTGWGL